MTFPRLHGRFATRQIVEGRTMSAEQDKAVVRRWFRACNDRDLPAEEAAHIPGVPGPQDGDGGGRVGRPSRHEHAAVYRGVARGASPPRKLLKGTVNAYLF